MKRKLLLAALCVAGALGVNAQKDVTSQYITNATLSDGTNGWTKTFTKNQQTNDPADAFSNSVRGNNTVGYASEAYAGWGSLIQTAYSMKQTITLPAGSYRLVNYSFFRQGEAYNTNSSKSLAYLVAGNEKEPLKTLGSITAAGYANSQAEGANCFDSKMYRNVVEFDIAADDTQIEIGVEGTFDEAKSWCIVGMFELFDLLDLASVSSPTDMTYAITNPGFEYRDLTGWTNTPDGAFWYMNNGNWNNEHKGIGWVEKWAGANFPDASLSQTLTGLDNGLYEVTVMAQARGGNGFYLYANDNKVAIGNRGDYSVRTTVTDGNLTIKVGTESFAGDWTPVDNFRLKFYGDPLAAYQDLLDASVGTAQAFIDASPALSSAQITALQAIVDANDNDDKAFTEESQFNTAIETINDALTTYQSLVSPYAKFNALKTSANAIAEVEYTETTDDSHSTFATAITTQTSAADNAASATTINTAIADLTTAIKTYIAGAEPKNDGESFEITCLIENPSFSNNTIDGWTRTYSGGSSATSYTCNEFFNNTFDFYQNLTGLANGSYQLSVQAYCRPGDNGPAYTNYKNGINDVTAELYVNNDASRVGNIYAYTGSTSKKQNTGAWSDDYECVVEGGTNYFVPNCMEGASKYFADENVYKTTVAALVEDGNLKIGFRDETLTSNQWTIFDNFRLYYYGSSKLVYYQQYLPQLKREAGADIANALYANVTGKEKSDFQTALDATPASETEDAYKDVIDDITEKQTAFRAAVTAYDALVAAKEYAALTEITANIGSGVFQYPTNTTDKWTTYSDAKSAVDGYTVISSSTASAVQALVDALDDAIADYNGITLNAPAADKRYYLNIIDDGQEWDGNAITFVAGGRDGEGNYNVQYLATANPNLCQALKFTAVGGSADTYIISAVRADGGEQYLTTKLLAYEEGSNAQLRTTDDVTKAVSVKIQATTTDGQFKLLNVSADNAVIARNATNPDNGVFTDGDASFTVAEATPASVPGAIAAGKYATRIFPFTPSLPTGVKAYSCETVEGETLTLVEVATPVANVPYILENTTEDKADIAQSGYGVATTTSYTAGLLTGTYTETPITPDDNNYVLQTLNDKQAFYYVKDAFNNQPYRVYLSLPAQGGSAKPRTLYFNVDATGIAAISALTSDEVKAIYTTGGVKAQGLQKGLNIVQMKNGETKKIFVK